MLTAPGCAHMHTMHISLCYTCISIQPADKAVQYLINSYKLLLLIVSKTATSSRKIRRIGLNWTGAETRSQMTSHCNGNAQTLRSVSVFLSFLFFFLSVCLPPSRFLSHSILCNWPQGVHEVSSWRREREKETERKMEGGREGWGRGMNEGKRQ